MPWYAAHTITFFQYSDASAGEVSVWENIMLVESADDEAAGREAARLARMEEGNAGGRLEMFGRPGRLVFAGVRKVQLVMENDERPGHGSEISYSELTVASMAEVEALARGLKTNVDLDDTTADRPDV